MNCGIYQIRNKQTGMRYVGSSANLHQRRIQHFSLLKLDDHKNVHLQEAYREDPNCLVFEVLELASEDELKATEQRHLDSGEFSYNMASSANGGNGIESHPDREKIIERMRDAHLGYKHSEEFCQKMSRAKSGENHHFYGKKLSEEHRQKVGAAHKGKKRPAETGRKISAAQTGEGHHRFEGYYLTLFGKFASSRLAADASGVPMGHGWISDVCKNPGETITKTKFDRSAYLKKNFDRSIIGKTWSDIGFGFEPAA